MSKKVSVKSSWLRNLQSKLKRKPRSGMYVPEIDGLRFVAIFAVILFHAHIYYFQDGLISDFTEVSIGRWLEYAIGMGWYGVQLFFIISGFIICLPFALHQLRDGRPISLTRFFIRRFKRIEIPYFIALTISLALLLFVHGRSFSELLPHYLAGLTYTHNIFYYPDGGLNPLLPPAWTLELEIQFYLLAPFLSAIYTIKNNMVRYSIFVGSIMLLNILIPVLHEQLPSNVIFSKNFILHNLPYFLMGMLIVDLFVTKKSYGKEAGEVSTPRSFLMLWDSIGITCAIATLGLLSFGDFSSLLPFTLGLFVLGTLNGHLLKKLLSFRLFTIFGGMCYSIYLFHEHILSNSFYWFSPNILSKYAPHGLNYVGIFTIAFWILIASIPLYLLIEKPFMNSKKRKSD